MSDELAFDDVQILKLESAAILGHTCKVVVVEPDERGRPLEADALRARIAERLETVPRLRQRVAMPAGGNPRWERDTGFDLANHVVDAGGAPLSDEALRRAVGGLMAERLDHERPLWRLDLLGLTGGRVAVVGRIHHCMADGVSAMRMLAGIFWDPPATAGGEKESAPAAKAPAPARPRHAGLRTAARVPGTLRRELRPGKDSPLNRHIGSGREVAWTGAPLAELKRIEHAAGEGVTVNDVVLATVAGALRSWMDGDEAPESLRAQIPVSLHSREESSGEIGNRDSFLFVDLPLDEDDPAARLRRINAETHERKLDHDAETLYSFFHSLSHFKPLYREVTRLASGPREFALSVSNVPGPRHPVTVLGRRVERLASFAEPADRHALRVAVVSLGGELAFGLCSDPDAVSGLDGLATALDDSLAELKLLD